MLITGTEACSAIRSTVSCGPVRTPIPCTIRDSTRAVSRSDSPRTAWRSPSLSTSGCPPSSWTPVSNDTRVRVEGRSNTSATLFPASAREERRSAFSVSARSTSRPSSAAVSSSPVRKCLVNAGPHLEPLPRPRLPARSGALHLALTPAPRDRAGRDPRPGEQSPAGRVRELARGARLGRRAAAGGAAALVPYAGVPLPGERSPRAHLSQLAAGAPAPDRRLEPGPGRLRRGRLEPAARPRPRSGGAAHDLDAAA